MKRILLFLILISFSFCCVAQNIKFLDIPLGISINDFKQKLISKGFSYNSVESNNEYFRDTYLFKGRFAGEDVGVSVFVTTNSKVVYSVAVRFIDYTRPHNTTEDEKTKQLNKYNKIRKSICNKYNVPAEDWSFDNIVKSTEWNTTWWSIILTMSYETESKFQLQTIDLMYTDRVSEKKANLEIESDY